MTITLHMLAFVSGFLLDCLFGDPYWMPHPVRFMGNLISFLDKKLMGEKHKGEEKKADALKQQEILLEEAKLQGAKEMHQAVENAVAESQEAIQKILKEAEEACSQIREQAAQRKEEAVLAVIGKVVGEYGSC